LEIDVSGVAPPGATVVVADVFAPRPAQVGNPPVLACCLPGGGMSRRYFDLDVAPAEGNYSMARHLADRGLIVATIDHLGVGESSRPADGYALTPATVADVNAHVTAEILDRLRRGGLAPSLPPLPAAVSVGIGHSAGAGLSVHQQARHRSHLALALLGYHGRGLPGHLTDEERGFAGDPDGLRREIARLVRQRFDDPLPMMARGSSQLLVAGPMSESVHDGLVAARTNLLALVGLSSMIPGSYGPELARIDVPVFLGLGSLDLTDATHQVPSQFPASRDVSLFVLQGAGHNHNVAANRERLWDRLAQWAHSVLSVRAPAPGYPGWAPAPGYPGWAFAPGYPG
jgi:alpha-beta hydrolase superfamily lysophospholipase